MKIYVSGPISGRPDANKDAFNHAAKELRQDGHVAVVPHVIPAWSHDGPCPPSYAQGADGPHNAACYLRTDLITMLADCEAVYMLDGWEESVGARAEHATAAICGMPIFYEMNGSVL